MIIYIERSEEIFIPNQDSMCIHFKELHESKDHLLEEFSNKLNFPDYFGKSWDALYDCLVDLEWIKQKNLVLICEKAPKLKDSEFSAFEELIYDVSRYWDDNASHNILFVLCESFKSISSRSS